MLSELFSDLIDIEIEASYSIFIYPPRFRAEIMDNNTVVGTSDIVADVMTDVSMEEKKTIDIQDDVGEVEKSDSSAVVETVDQTGEEAKVPAVVASSVHIEVVASPLFRGDVIQHELYESAVPKSPVIDEEQRPMDKRSGLVDRHRQLKQALCYDIICPSLTYISHNLSRLPSHNLSPSFSISNRCCVTSAVPSLAPHHWSSIRRRVSRNTHGGWKTTSCTSQVPCPLTRTLTLARTILHEPGRFVCVFVNVCNSV